MNSLRLLIISFMMGTISISGVAYSSSGNGGKGSSDNISKLLQDNKNKQAKDESKGQVSGSVDNNALSNISNLDKNPATNGSEKGSEQQTGKTDTGINLGQVNITPLVIEPEISVTLYEKATGIFDDASNKELLGDNLSGSDSLLENVLGDNLYKGDIGLEANINPVFSENTLALNLNESILSAVPELESYMMLLMGLMLVVLSINKGNKSNRKART